MAGHAGWMQDSSHIVIRGKLRLGDRREACRALMYTTLLVHVEPGVALCANLTEVIGFTAVFRELDGVWCGQAS